MVISWPSQKNEEEKAPGNSICILVRDEMTSIGEQHWFERFIFFTSRHCPFF